EVGVEADVAEVETEPLAPREPGGVVVVGARVLDVGRHGARAADRAAPEADRVDGARRRAALHERDEGEDRDAREGPHQLTPTLPPATSMKPLLTIGVVSSGSPLSAASAAVRRLTSCVRSAMRCIAPKRFASRIAPDLLLNWRPPP